MSCTGRLRVHVSLALLFIGLALALWGASHSTDGWDWGGPALNLGTEMIGAAAAYVLLQVILGRETKKREVTRLLTSAVHDVTIQAAEEARQRGWLSDGSLRGANFGKANLSEARLSGADLQRASLVETDLEKADLQSADLRKAQVQAPAGSLAFTAADEMRVVRKSLAASALVAAQPSGA